MTAASSPVRIPDRFFSLVRLLPIRGKRSLFGRFAPPENRRVRTLGFELTLDLRDEQQLRMFLGCFDRRLERHLRRLLPVGGTFIDVGANIGYVSIHAARAMGPAGRILAFEPGPAYVRLEKHMAQVPLAKCFQLALGAEPGSLTLHVPGATAYRNFNVSVVPQRGAIPVVVPQRRLDDVLDEEGVEHVDLVKIDVEGSEAAVLKGAPSLNRRCRYLICEINGGYLGPQGSSPRHLIEQINDMGFSLIDAWGDVPPGFPEETNGDGLFKSTSAG
jgi:FkbM family methyltransferase